MNYTKLSIPLSEQEQRALKMAASKACRRPRDHVRFIVLSALGVIEPSAELKVVKRVEPVTALAVNEKSMSVTVESGTHALITNN